MAKIGNYLKEVRAELRKVTWPNKQTVRNNTIVVLVFCLLLVVIIGVLDWLFSLGMSALLPN